NERCLHSSDSPMIVDRRLKQEARARIPGGPDIHAVFHRVRRSSLFLNTGWALLAQSSRLALQTIYFVLIARALGVEGFGALAAALAIIAAVTPFAALGSGNVLVMHVARDRGAFHLCWGNVLLTVTLCGSVAIIGIMTVGHWLIPNISLSTLFTLGVSELLLGRLVEA